jgi:deoxyadenosine/deoxycytidine kinase
MAKVAIDGNIGSGKTHYLRQLEKEGYLVNHEDVKAWGPWLSKYGSDMKRYALGFQLKILHDQTNLPYKADQINIYERSPFTLQKVFGDMLYRDRLMDDDEYRLHNDYVGQFGWKPDVIIYLYCDPEVCHRRIQSRDSISGDSKISVDYLKSLHTQHELVFDTVNCDIPIYKVNSQEPAETVYANIKHILNGLKLKTKTQHNIT